jgi:hypothetical protein
VVVVAASDLILDASRVGDASRRNQLELHIHQEEEAPFVLNREGRACSGSGLATASMWNCGGSDLAACGYHVRRAVRVRSCGTLVLGTAAGWRLRVRQTA